MILPEQFESMMIERYHRETLCERCERPIAYNAYSVKVSRHHRYGTEKPAKFCRSTRLDYACAIDHNPLLFARALEKSPYAPYAAREVAPGTVLGDLLAIRVLGVTHRARARPQYVPATSGSTGRVTVVGGAPENSAQDSPEHVSPARDQNHRPRVRVLCAGMAATPTCAAGRALWNTLKAGTWSSTKREYSFVTMDDHWQLPSEDPSQPIVGTLYVAFAPKNATIEGLPALALWGALSLPTPVLWLVGLSARQPRDEHTVAFRQLLHGSGLSPDDAAVLCSPKPTRRALDELVALLDEKLSHPVEVRQTQDSSYLCATQILREHCNEEIEDWALTFASRASLSCFAFSPQTETVIHELVKRLIEHQQLDFAAELLVRNGARDPQLLLRWINAVVLSEAQVTEYFEDICALAVDLGVTLPVEPMIDRMLREPSGPEVSESFVHLASAFIEGAAASKIERILPLFSDSTPRREALRMAGEEGLQRARWGMRRVPRPTRVFDIR